MLERDQWGSPASAAFEGTSGRCRGRAGTLPTLYWIGLWSGASVGGGRDAAGNSLCAGRPGSSLSVGLSASGCAAARAVVQPMFHVSLADSVSEDAMQSTDVCSGDRDRRCCGGSSARGKCAGVELWRELWAKIATRRGESGRGHQRILG